MQKVYLFSKTSFNVKHLKNVAVADKQYILLLIIIIKVEPKISGKQ